MTGQRRAAVRELWGHPSSGDGGHRSHWVKVEHVGKTLKLEEHEVRLGSVSGIRYQELRGNQGTVDTGRAG